MQLKTLKSDMMEHPLHQLNLPVINILSYFLN